MRRRRRDGNNSPQKKKIQYKIQWEMKKMDTQFLTSTKMINVTKEPSHTYIKTLKEEILEDFIEKFMENI
jgi:hypothetical protein